MEKLTAAHAPWDSNQTSNPHPLPTLQEMSTPELEMYIGDGLNKRPESELYFLAVIRGVAYSGWDGKTFKVAGVLPVKARTVFEAEGLIRDVLKSTAGDNTIVEHFMTTFVDQSQLSYMSYLKVQRIDSLVILDHREIKNMFDNLISIDDYLEDEPQDG